MAGQHLQNGGVIAFDPHHVLFKQFQRDNIQPRHHFHRRFRCGLIVDQRTGIVRFKGIGHTQRHIRLTQHFCRAGVNRFHPHIRHLVSHVIVGMAQLAHSALPHQIGISRRQVKFLVDDRLAGAGQSRQTRKRHLGIAPVKFPHQPFGTLGIARDNRHFLLGVHVLHGAGDPVVQRNIAFVPPARQVHEPGVHPGALQHQRGHKGRMRLAQTRQQFADLQHMFRQPEMAVAAQALQVDQAIARAVDPFRHKGPRLFNIRRMIQHSGMGRFHRGPDTGQRVMPAVAGIGVGKLRIDPRFAGLFMFQQQVGDAAKGRHHEHAAIKIGPLTPADEQRIPQFTDTGHRRAPDFFNSMMGHVCPFGQSASSSAGA